MIIKKWLYINRSWFKETKKLDADPKAIQQTEFVEQLKKLDAVNNATDTARNDQSKSVSILEKNQRN